MGALLGLLAGVGVLLMWRSGPRRPAPKPRSSPTLSQRTTELLAQAGYPSIRPQQLFVLCGVAGVVTFTAVVAVSRSGSIALTFGGFAAYAPVAIVKMRRRQRTTELRELWPDVTDNLCSAIRAGMSLPEAVGQVAVRGPEQLREAFAAFAADYRATGRFGDCLDALKARLADPVADRIVESLRVTREVGGSDLGRLLRTLSQFLREDARTRAELETRQGWTVNAARLALAAPWVVLAMLALRPQTVAAYNSPAGVLVLAVGGGVSLLAYRVMLRIARLPEPARVLR
jgi:tight adherence protein B